MPWGSAAERRNQLIATITAVRTQVDPAPPVVIAASGPRMLTTAAEYADRILLAAAPDATEDDLARMVGTVTAHTDRDVRFTLQLVGIGEHLPTWLSTRLGHTTEKLRAAGAAGLRIPQRALRNRRTDRPRRAGYRLRPVLERARQ